MTALHKILIADDDEDSALFLSELVRAEGLEAEVVPNGKKVLERLEQEDLPDLLLLDVMMPEMDGVETCRRVKEFAGERFLPVILVTVRNDVESKVRGLKSGADDYLCKPFNNRELVARVRAMLRIKDLQDRIRATREAARGAGTNDALTGVMSHRQMTKRLEEEFKRAERYNDPLSCLLLGLDGFRDVNEKHGTEFGDHVLRKVARLLRRDVREIDIVTRFGGDRFLVLLPKTHFSGSLSVAERIWRDMNSTTFEQGDKASQVTASMGISFFPSKGVSDKESLVRYADRALQKAKDEGRNRICLYQHFDYFYQPTM